MRAFCLAMIVGVVAGACVRLDPPNNYVCRTDSDCPVGERCAQDGTCIGKEQCLYSSECASDQSCDTSMHKCFTPQCTASHEDACAPYKCADLTCKYRCDSDFDCQSSFTCDFLSRTCKTLSGHNCTSSLECQPGKQCCGPAGALVCGDCFPGGGPCTQASDCMTGLCCQGMFGKECSYSSTACSL